MALDVAQKVKTANAVRNFRHVSGTDKFGNIQAKDGRIPLGQPDPAASETKLTTRLDDVNYYTT